MINEPTNMEILEALNIFSEKIDKRIDDLEDRLVMKIDALEFRIVQRLDYHEAWLNRIDQNVVWKKDLKA